MMNKTILKAIEEMLLLLDLEHLQKLSSKINQSIADKIRKESENISTESLNAEK